MPKTPSLTLTDRVTKKSATLDDSQACRALLTQVCLRVSADVGDPAREGAWRDRYPEKADGTERVAVQLLRKAGGLVEATEMIKRGESLEWILEGTDLAEDFTNSDHRGDRPATQVPLPKGRDQEITKEDVDEKIDELWPLFVNRVEATEGEKSQSISVTLTWNPPTKNRDGYVSVGASMSISTGRSTRTGVVTKRKGKGSKGGYQFALFAEPVE